MADIDSHDFEFLTAMSSMLDEGARMARAYLAASDPATRRANVADLARNTVQVHTDLMDQIQGWLDGATPPGMSHENGEWPDDVEVM